MLFEHKTGRRSGANRFLRSFAGAHPFPSFGKGWEINPSTGTGGALLQRCIASQPAISALAAEVIDSLIASPYSVSPCKSAVALFFGFFRSASSAKSEVAFGLCLVPQFLSVSIRENPRSLLLFTTRLCVVRPIPSDSTSLKHAS
jgi:hypothetical protein